MNIRHIATELTLIKISTKRWRRKLNRFDLYCVIYLFQNKENIWPSGMNLLQKWPLNYISAHQVLARSLFELKRRYFGKLALSTVSSSCLFCECQSPAVILGDVRGEGESFLFFWCQINLRLSHSYRHRGHMNKTWQTFLVQIKFFFSLASINFS